MVLLILEIKEFLKVHHKYNVSLSTIKRHLKKMNLFKRPLAQRRIDRNEVSNLVREELLASGSNVGYRRMRDHLRRQKGIILRREDVR